MTMPLSTRKTDGGRSKGPQNCANVLEIRMQFQIPNSKRVYTTIHGSFVTTPGNIQTIATALFSSLSNSWASRLGTFMHTGTSFQNLYVRDMTLFTNPVFVGTGTAVAGTGAGAAMPPGAAIVLTEEVNIRGRGAKGRMYIGGWAQSADVTTGGISGTVQTALNNWGTDIISALSAQSLTACVAQLPRVQYQGVTGTVHPQRPAGHPTVLSYVCQDLIWDSQRRRAQL